MLSHFKLLKKKSYNSFLPFIYYRYKRLFFGSLIKTGNKLKAYNFLLKLKNKLKLKEKIEFHIIFIFSLLKITPHIILSYLKIGGMKQGVPLFISWRKKITYAVKWIKIAMTKKYKSIKIDNLANEISLCIYDKGLSSQIKKKTYIEGFSNRFLLKRFKYKG